MGIEQTSEEAQARTQAVDPTDDPPLPPAPVALTAKAVEMAKQAMAEEGLSGVALRVGVYGGGCAGLQYLLDFDATPRDIDFVFELDGLRVFVDPDSAAHLQGTTINYVEGPSGSGFKFENPNRSRACGCGMAY